MEMRHAEGFRLLPKRAKIFQEAEMAAEERGRPNSARKLLDQGILRPVIPEDAARVWTMKMFFQADRPMMTNVLRHFGISITVLDLR